jgi:hypothetical protein
MLFVPKPAHGESCIQYEFKEKKSAFVPRVANRVLDRTVSRAEPCRNPGASIPSAKLGLN